jgi:hypothetical protein
VTTNPLGPAKANFTIPQFKYNPLTLCLSFQNGFIFDKSINNFQSANSKEYIALDKGAKQDFFPETHFDIIRGISDAFSAEIKKYSTQFGYRSLLNVPPDRDVDAADANVITYKQPINMIKTWNKMTDNIIAKNANKVWGHLQLENFHYQEN